MSDQLFESPRYRNTVDGVDCAVFLDYSKDPPNVVLPFAAGRSCLLEAVMIEQACRQHVERTTGMSYDEFIDGMRRLLEPAT